MDKTIQNQRPMYYQEVDNCHFCLEKYHPILAEFLLNSVRKNTYCYSYSYKFELIDCWIINNISDNVGNLSYSRDHVMSYDDGFRLYSLILFIIVLYSHMSITLFLFVLLKFVTYLQDTCNLLGSYLVISRFWGELLN